jgi:YggT family protein
MSPSDFIVEIIRLYIAVVIIHVILTWLIVLDVVKRRNHAVSMIDDVFHRLTEPALRPIRRRLPNFGGIDISPLILILLLLFVAHMVSGGSLWGFIAWLIGLYITIVVIQVILSWLIVLDVIDRRNHFVYMITEAFRRLTEPALRPIRSRLPDLGGLDISPLILIFLLYFISGYVLVWLSVKVPI